MQSVSSYNKEEKKRLLNLLFICYNTDLNKYWRDMLLSNFKAKTINEAIWNYEKANYGRKILFLSLGIDVLIEASSVIKYN